MAAAKELLVCAPRLDYPISLRVSLARLGHRISSAATGQLCTDRAPFQLGIGVCYRQRQGTLIAGSSPLLKDRCGHGDPLSAGKHSKEDAPVTVKTFNRLLIT